MKLPWKPRPARIRAQYVPRPKLTFVEKLVAKIQAGAPDECWPWIGARSKRGSPRIRLPGPATSGNATRAWYEMKVQTIPEHLKVVRTCTTVGCMNPAHLGLDTTGSRAGAPRGEAHGRSKLKAEDIPEIRRRLAKGESHSKIAADYDVTSGPIGQIATGRAWGWVA